MKMIVLGRGQELFSFCLKLLALQSQQTLQRKNAEFYTLGGNERCAQVISNKF